MRGNFLASCDSTLELVCGWCRRADLAIFKILSYLPRCFPSINALARVKSRGARAGDVILFLIPGGLLGAVARLCVVLGVVPRVCVRLVVAAPDHNVSLARLHIFSAHIPAALSP